jgi:hypothetical protein
LLTEHDIDERAAAALAEEMSRLAQDETFSENSAARELRNRPKAISVTAADDTLPADAFTS